MKGILILSIISSILLMAGSPIHDLMDSRIKGKSYLGSMDDNSAAEDGLGILPLQHYSGTTDVNNELLVQKVFNRIVKSETDKTKTTNIRTSLTTGTVGNTNDQILLSKVGFTTNYIPGSLSSCKEIKTNYPTSVDGVYQLSFGNVYCDMTTDGGGWTVAINFMGNDTTSSLLATDGTYMHTSTNCKNTLSSSYSCIDLLSNNNFLSKFDTVMFYVNHQDAPTQLANPWISTKIAGVNNLKSLFTHQQSATAKCTGGNCSTFFNTVSNTVNQKSNNWFRTGPTILKTDISYTSGSIAFTHMYNENGSGRCNSDLDRFHNGWDGYGIAYYRNSYTDNCYYDSTASKKISSRVMFR